MVGGGAGRPSGAPAGGDTLATGLRAWRILAAAARGLLDSGRLRDAAALGAALSALGATLADLLCAQPSRAAGPQPPPPTTITAPYGET